MINTGQDRSVLKWSTFRACANAGIGITGLLAIASSLQHASIGYQHHREAVSNHNLPETALASEMKHGDQEQNLAIGLAVAGVVCLATATVSETCRQLAKQL